MPVLWKDPHLTAIHCIFKAYPRLSSISAEGAPNGLGRLGIKIHTKRT